MNYSISEKNLVPARNILLGKITLQRSTLTDLQRKLLVVAANAYLLDADAFLPFKELSPIVVTVMGKYKAEYAHKAESYYNLIRDLAGIGARMDLKRYKVFKKSDVSVRDMEIRNNVEQSNRKYLQAKQDLDAYKQKYSSLVSELIDQQQNEAKQLYDSSKPSTRFRARRFDFPVPAHRTTESFIAELRSIYGNAYDYSNVRYVNVRTMVSLTCRKHGNTFTRTAANLLKGVGCPLCRKEHGDTWADVTATYDAERKNARWTTERFIQESRACFGDDAFDYSHCKYVNSKTPVVLIRKTDGKRLEVSPNEHLRSSMGGYGERKYYEGKTDREKVLFVAHRMSELLEHPVYVPMQHIEDSKKGFRCICPIHGEFTSNLTIVNSGRCCPDCDGKGESLGERNVRKYLQAHSIAYKQEYFIRDRRYFDTFARVDFYLPDRRMFIEFNGEQHYGIANCGITHDSRDFEEQSRRDTQLRLYAKDKNIELVEVPYIFRRNVGDFLDRYLHA